MITDHALICPVCRQQFFHYETDIQELCPDCKKAYYTKQEQKREQDVIRSHKVGNNSS